MLLPDYWRGLLHGLAFAAALAAIVYLNGRITGLNDRITSTQQTVDAAFSKLVARVEKLEK